MSPALFTNQDAAIVELTAKLAKVTAERDRARDIAVALEQRLAAGEALASRWLDERLSIVRDASQINAGIRVALRACEAELRAALDGAA